MIRTSIVVAKSYRYRLRLERYMAGMSLVNKASSDQAPGGFDDILVSQN